jgi:hypothetical protein
MRMHCVTWALDLTSPSLGRSVKVLDTTAVWDRCLRRRTVAPRDTLAAQNHSCRRPIGFRTWSPCSPRDSLRRVPVPRRRSDLDRCNRPDRHHPDVSSPCGLTGPTSPARTHLTASWMAMRAFQLNNGPDHCPRPARIVAPFSYEWSPALSVVQCASNGRGWTADCAPGPTRDLAA